jgi:hypothetical protein
MPAPESTTSLGWSCRNSANLLVGHSSVFIGKVYVSGFVSRSLIHARV